jgi:HTH-type transcriptional regulator / antitoxin HipB
MAYTGTVTSAESLGRILQQARLLSGLSQRELARRLGTTQNTCGSLRPASRRS